MVLTSAFLLVMIFNNPMVMMVLVHTGPYNTGDYDGSGLHWWLGWFWPMQCWLNMVLVDILVMVLVKASLIVKAHSR